MGQEAGPFGVEQHFPPAEVQHEESRDGHLVHLLHGEDYLPDAAVVAVFRPAGREIGEEAEESVQHVQPR